MIKSPCQKERQRHLGWRGPSNRPYEPACGDDGRYKPLQCNTTYCWCVDSHGYELPGTMKLKGLSLDCSKAPGRVNGIGLVLKKTVDELRVII